MYKFSVVIFAVCIASAYSIDGFLDFLNPNKGGETTSGGLIPPLLGDKGIVTKLLEAIINLLRNILNPVQGVLDKLFGDLGKLIQNILSPNTNTNIVESLAQNLKQTLKNVTSIVGNLGNPGSLLGGVQNIIEDLVDSVPFLKGLIGDSSLLSNLGGIIEKLLAALLGPINRIVNSLLGNLGGSLNLGGA